MTTLLTIVLAILACFAAAAVLYLLARWVGLARCLTCGRACVPWAAYCWTHSPDNPANRPSFSWFCATCRAGEGEEHADWCHRQGVMR